MGKETITVKDGKAIIDNNLCVTKLKDGEYSIDGLAVIISDLPANDEFAPFGCYILIDAISDPRTKQQIAESVKFHVAQLNKLIEKAASVNLTVNIHQAFLSRNDKITCSIYDKTEY